MQNTNQRLYTQKTPIWGAFFEDSEENWLRYNDTALYIFMFPQVNSAW